MMPMEGRRDFHEQLDELHVELLRMANATLEVLERTRTAFDRLDPEVAEGVVAGDDEIDDYVIRIEEEGIELLARQAPVAIDLRTIITIMRLSQELERAADNCVNVSKAVLNLQGRVLPPWVRDNMDEMFDWARRILADAMDAFKERDPDKVKRLVEMDDEVDLINLKFLTATYDKECLEDTDLVIRVVMIARFLERVADHGVNIGKEVHFMVTGRFMD
jgi:phosphate transport system protein